MSPKFLSIDIQRSCIIATLFSQGRKGKKIHARLEHPLSIAQDITHGPSYFSSLESQLSATLKSVGDYGHCTLALPVDFFFFRTLELPFKSKKKIEQILPFELEERLPLTRDQFKKEFMPLSAPPRSGGGCRVLSASMDIRVLEKFNGVFQNCGLSPDVLTLGDGYTQALSWAREHPHQAPTIFVHGEKDQVTVHGIQDGEIFFIRTTHLEYQKDGKGLIQHLNITCLSVGELLYGDACIQHIVLGGDLKNHPALNTSIKEKMGLDVSNAPEKNPPATALSPMFNFHRTPSPLGLFLTQHGSNLMLTGIFFLCFILAMGSLPLTRSKAAQREIAQLDGQIRRTFLSHFPGVTTLVDPVHQMRVKLAAARKKKNMNPLYTHVRNIDILQNISQKLPRSMDLIFTRLIRTENTLSISGTADQFKTVDEMKTKLKSIESFKEVDIHSAALDKINKSDAQVKRVKFNLKISL